MNNQNLKIFLIAIFLLSFSGFPQDSLSVKSKCDSLKAAYEAKLIDVKIIENEMKMIKPYHLPYDDYSYFRTKQKWDSLYVAYKKQWTEIKILTSKYLLCLGKDISSYEKTLYEIPPAPPPPCEPVDPLTDSWSYRTPTQPYLPDDEQNSFNNYISTNYPIQALKNSISGSVELSFLCNEEGSVKNILVLKENPENFGFREIAIEGIKTLKFRPAIQNNLPIIMRIKKKIDFKPPQPPHPAIKEEVFGWDYNTVPKLLPDYQEKMKQYIMLNYPQLAIKNNISAKVILAFICNTDGYPEDIKIVSEEPSNFGFGKIAVEALKIVKFYPAHYSERDVSVKMKLPINFSPPKKEQLFKCDSVKLPEVKIESWSADASTEQIKELEFLIKEALEKRYPPLPLKMGISGSINIFFTLTKENQVINMGINEENPKDLGFVEITFSALEKISKDKLIISKSNCDSYVVHKIFFLTPTSKEVKTKTITR